MHYYHFVADTPFIGTENHYFLEFKKPLTQEEINKQCEEFRNENAESYSYMVEDGYYSYCSDYYEDYSCYWEEITDPEEWEELQEEYA